MAVLWSNISALLPPDEGRFPLQFGDSVDASVAELLLRCRRRLYAPDKTPHPRDPALTTAQIVTDLSWERLNTGTWRDVDKEWRRVYAYGCLFKALALCRGGDCGDDDGPSPESVRQAVRTCDLGLLMGASIMDNVLHSLVQILQTEVRRAAREEEEEEAVHTEPAVQAKVALLYPYAVEGLSTDSIAFVECLKTNPHITECYLSNDTRHKSQTMWVLCCLQLGHAVLATNYFL